MRRSKMEFINKIQEYFEGRQLRKFQRYNTWEGLIPGDLVNINGSIYMYKGISENGGPGMVVPEPVFGFPYDITSDLLLYLRHEETYPYQPLPECMKESESPIQSHDGKFIGFLNARREDMEKVDHIEFDKEDRKTLRDELRTCYEALQVR